MLNVAIGLVFLGIFAALLMFARARSGVVRFDSVWAAQSVSLVLVCILMTAGGFLFKGIVE